MKCRVCKCKLDRKKDAYELCRKCYPAWRNGYEQGKEIMKSYVLGGIEECNQ